MQTITVDMTPGFRQPTIHYSQNDVGTTFAIDLRSRFGDTLPASPTVKIQATKPSGFGFSIEADSVVDSVATFTTVATMTDEAGRFLAELEVSDSGVVLYTANFYMEGEANPHPIGTTDGSQETIIPTLTLLVERVEAAASSVLDMTVNATTLAAGSQATYSHDEDTNTATFGIPQGEAGAGAAGVTASAYSSSSTYAVGDYVIHNNNLYRCTTAITTAEAFTAAHWTQVVLGDDVCDLKSDFGVCFNGGFISVPLTYTDGGYINNTNGEVITYSGWKYTDFVDISDRENDTIYVSTEAPSSTLYNGFYNSEHTFIKPFNANAGEISDVPVSAKYVRFSIQSNYNASLSIYKTGYRKAVDELEEKIESSGDGIVVLNKDVESYMIQTTAPRNIHLDDATKPKPLSFIHFSDIHTRQPLWNRVVEYGNKFSDYIDFIIHSGDYVGSYQGAYVDLYANGITPNIPLYNVVGNHDTYATASGTLASKAATYGLIFNHQDNWDVTAFMSGSNSMTYYKKFTDSNVWVFVLDNYYDQSAQVAWLEERLNNALNDGAHVITVMHEVSRRIVDKLDTGFQTLNDYESVGGNGGNSQGVERISPFDAVIANFINNGGHFVANLVGHEHSDMIGYTSTGVLNIAVECATDDIVWSDARREEGTKTWDAFNVFTVNPNTNTLAIVRIGDNSDTYGRPRNVLCYDYLNKQIVTTH